MWLYASRVLPVSPRAVWQVVGDPELMSLWKPKCVRCKALDATPQIGSRYDAVFCRGRRERESRCEIQEFLPERCIRLRYSSANRFVEETFELSEVTHGTELSLSVDLSESGIPWQMLMVVWLLHTFGCSVGKSSLDGIAALLSGRKGALHSHSGRDNF